MTVSSVIAPVPRDVAVYVCHRGVETVVVAPLTRSASPERPGRGAAPDESPALPDLTDTRADVRGAAAEHPL